MAISMGPHMVQTREGSIMKKFDWAGAFLFVMGLLLGFANGFNTGWHSDHDEAWHHYSPSPGIQCVAHYDKGNIKVDCVKVIHVKD